MCGNVFPKTVRLGGIDHLLDWSERIDMGIYQKF